MKGRKHKIDPEKLGIALVEMGCVEFVSDLTGDYYRLAGSERLIAEKLSETGIHVDRNYIASFRRRYGIGGLPVKPAPPQASGHGGRREGAGRKRNISVNDYAQSNGLLIKWHKQDVLVLSKYTIRGQGITHRDDSYTPSSPAPVIALPTGGGKKGRQGGRSDRRMALAQAELA